MKAALSLVPCLLAGGAWAAEHFTVKDRLATVRLLVLDGDRVTCTDYDGRGVPSSRTVALDSDYMVDQGPRDEAAPRPDGTSVEATPLGRFQVVYRGGIAVERRELTRHAPDPARLRAALLALEAKPWVRQGPFAAPGISDNGLVYRAYGALGLFVPWTLAEQAIFGLPVDPAVLDPGDIVVLTSRPDEVPDRLLLACGEGEVLMGSPARGVIERHPLSRAPLPGRVVGARRVLGTPYDGYMSRAPAQVHAPGARREPLGRPWRRMQGVASFYGHGDIPGLHGGIEPIARPSSRDAAGGHVHTAFHRSLAVGSRLKVRSLDSGRRVTVVVEGRAEFDSDRSLEVCYEAAEELGLDALGVGLVEMEPLDPPAHAGDGPARSGASAPIRLRAGP